MHVVNINAFLNVFLAQVTDAGDAVRAELREHEQALLEEEAVRAERANHAELQVGSTPALSRLASQQANRQLRYNLLYLLRA